MPDNIALRIVAERIEAPDAQSGFILDGFPRTIGQAVEFDKMLAERGPKLGRVLNLRVDEDALFNRIVTRAREMAAEATRFARTTIQRLFFADSLPILKRPRRLWTTMNARAC